MLLRLSPALALSAWVASAPAATLFQDDFEAETLAAPTPSLSNWTITNGSVDVIGTGFFAFYGPGRYLDLDGTSQAAGRITTLASFNILAGRTYTIAFRYGKNGSAKESLSFGIVGLTSETLDLPSGVIPSLLDYSISVVAPVSVTAALFFAAQGGDNQGPVIDDIVFSESTIAAVPVPAAAWLLGSSLLALAMKRRQPSI